MKHLTFEQRKAQVALIGNRVSGSIKTELRLTGVLPVRRADTCARCGDTGEITIPCPNCSGGASDTPTRAAAPVRKVTPDTTVTARAQLDALKRGR